MLIPSFNGGSDHARNGQDLSKCVDWILARNGDPASIFFGQVRTQAVGATGHSAGGLSAILATSNDPRIGVLSLMDPVDNGGQGVAALAAVNVPVAITWSEPSACNASGSAEVLYAAARCVRRAMRIVGANHTDPQAITLKAALIRAHWRPNCGSLRMASSCWEYLACALIRFS